SGAKNWENPVFAWIYAQYGRLLRITIPRSKAVIAVVFVIVAGALGLATRLGTEFLPSLDEGVVWVRANLPPGTSLHQSAQIAADMRRIILQSKEVRVVGSQSGRNDSGTDPFGPNRNEMLLGLQPYSEWPAGKDKAQLIDELSEKLRANIPGVTLNF